MVALASEYQCYSLTQSLIFDQFKILNSYSHRKFGFVTYANNDSAKNCLTEKKLKNHRLDEKEIEVKRAMPRGNKDKNASLKTHKIFVGGLDTDVDEETSK